MHFRTLETCLLLYARVFGFVFYDNLQPAKMPSRDAARSYFAGIFYELVVIRRSYELRTQNINLVLKQMHPQIMAS